ESRRRSLPLRQRTTGPPRAHGLRQARRADVHRLPAPPRRQALNAFECPGSRWFCETREWAIPDAHSLAVRFLADTIARRLPCVLEAHTCSARDFAAQLFTNLPKRSNARGNSGPVEAKPSRKCDGQSKQFPG